jgi:Zn-dependent peptidase ImmA (M78 family)
MDYVEKTNKLATILRKKGWIVDLKCDMSDEYYGLIYYNLNLIEINKNNTEKETFTTLCHEAGHLVSYILLGKIVSQEYFGNTITEKMADVLGFFINKVI